MALADFGPSPHEEAIALIRGKPVVTREVFDGILPELRARAFTITGVEGAHVLQRARDLIADLALGGKGRTWSDVKSDLVETLNPYLGDQAERRAELLMRTHGFQAFQASNWRVAQEDADTTHLQYLATEDERVRESHLALNGLILPKDDAFWSNHFPPWEWGCRCRTRAMNPDLVDLEREADADRDPDQRLVLEGPALERLRDGQLQREGKTFDVTAPSDGPEGDAAYQFDPGNLSLSLANITGRMEPAEAAEFRAFAERTWLAPGVSLARSLATAPQRAATRRGAPVAQPRIAAGELPAGPRSPLEFGRARAARIRARPFGAEQFSG